MFFTGRENSEIIRNFSAIGFFIFCVPAVFLFIRYVLLNKNLVVEYRVNSISMSIGEYSKTLKIENINNVETRVSLPVYFNGFRYFPTDSYFYAVIYLNSGDSFVVTSLVDNELIETIDYFKDKLKVTRKWSFICWPPSHRFNS